LSRYSYFPEVPVTPVTVILPLAPLLHAEVVPTVKSVAKSYMYIRLVIATELPAQGHIMETSKYEPGTAAVVALTKTLFVVSLAPKGILIVLTGATATGGSESPAL
jgi:hypothetical protein